MKRREKEKKKYNVREITSTTPFSLPRSYIYISCAKHMLATGKQPSPSTPVARWREKLFGRRGRKQINETAPSGNHDLAVAVKMCLQHVRRSIMRQWCAGAPPTPPLLWCSIMQNRLRGRSQSEMPRDACSISRELAPIRDRQNRGRQQPWTNEQIFRERGGKIDRSRMKLQFSIFKLLNRG